MTTKEDVERWRLQFDKPLKCELCEGFRTKTKRALKEHKKEVHSY